MESAFLFIAGNGQSSKNNIEALLNDYIVPLRQQKIKSIIVPIVLNRASEGQIIAAKFAREKELDCIVYTPDPSRLSAFPASDFVEAKDPLKEACKLGKGDSKVYGFLLWDDEDQDSADALATFSSRGIGCYDLTNGLADITPVEGIKPPKEKPAVPEQEQISLEEDEAPEEPSEADLEDYSEDEEALMEAVYDAIYEIARVAVRRALRDYDAS